MPERECNVDTYLLVRFSHVDMVKEFDLKNPAFMRSSHVDTDLLMRFFSCRHWYLSCRPSHVDMDLLMSTLMGSCAGKILVLF